MGRWSQDRQFEQPFGRMHVPRGPPPARSPEPPAPSSARQRPRGQCCAGGGLRGGDCLRLARERKVGHGRPAERGGNRAVAGERRRVAGAAPGSAAHGHRARRPGGSAGGARPRRAFVPAGGGAWGGPGLGGRPRRNPRDSAQPETRAGRAGPGHAACRALLRFGHLRLAAGGGASGNGRGRHSGSGGIPGRQRGPGRMRDGKGIPGEGRKRARTGARPLRLGGARRSGMLHVVSVRQGRAVSRWIETCFRS